MWPVLLLIYLCTPPDEGFVRMSCVAREVHHHGGCAQAVALAEASVPPGRVWHPVTCMATGPVTSPAAAPRQERRPAR